MTMRSSLNMQSVAGVTIVQSTALFPPSVVVALNSLETYPIYLSIALSVTVFWEAVFAVLRGRGFSFHGVTTALVVVALVPNDLSLWQLSFALSFGVVLGEAVFGGRGFGFLNPAVVALSMLLISFPEVQLVQPTLEFAIATGAGAVLLLVFGLISWRVIFAAVISVLAAMLLGGAEVDLLALVTAVAFGLIFLICDPTSASATNTGRWVFGALAGAMIVVFSPVSGPSAEGIVFASLMASIFAPMIDHLVVLAHARRRKVMHA